MVGRLSFQHFLICFFVLKFTGSQRQHTVRERTWTVRANPFWAQCSSPSVDASFNWTIKWFLLCVTSKHVCNLQRFDPVNAQPRAKSIVQRHLNICHGIHNCAIADAGWPTPISRGWGWGDPVSIDSARHCVILGAGVPLPQTVLGRRAEQWYPGSDLEFRTGQV